MKTMKSAFKYWLTDEDGIFGFAICYVIPIITAFIYQPFYVALVISLVLLALMLWGYCALNNEEEPK